MALTQCELTKRFAKGETSGRSRGTYINGDTLFGDLGYPILVRREFGYLLNMDRHPHLSYRQKMCREYASKIVEVPFSLLAKAGLSYKLISIDKDRNNFHFSPKWYAYLKYREYSGWWNRRRVSFTAEEYNRFPEEYRASLRKYTIYEIRPDHIIDGLLIEYENNDYLLCIEENNYSLFRLAHKVDTINIAFESMIPAGASSFTLRQGIWYFSTHTTAVANLFVRFGSMAKIYMAMASKFTLPDGQTTATRGINIDGHIFVSGVMRSHHHRIVRLHGIYEVLPADIEASWIAERRIK